MTRLSPSTCLFVARALRDLGDGFVAVILPAYLLARGHSPLAVGILSTVSLLGSSLLTIGIGLLGARFDHRHAEKSRYDIGEMPDWRALLLKTTRQPPRELSFEEEERLFANLREDIRDAVEFLLKSGWRRDEVLKLRWSDCNLDMKQASTRIKGGDIITRPLSKDLVAIIQRQVKATPFVFTYECQKSRAKRRKGQRYPLTSTALRKPFAGALEGAQIESFRLHDLRHTRGTRIVRSTGSLAAAKEALKHRSI